jgi:ribosome-binding factor A
LPDVGITEVQVSADVDDAYVFVSLIGDEKHEQKIFHLLINKLPAIRQDLFSRISLKYSPCLNLRLDQSISRGHKILDLLDSLLNE